MDWKQQAKNQNLVPRIELHDKKSKGDVLVLENVKPCLLRAYSRFDYRCK